MDLRVLFQSSQEFGDRIIECYLTHFGHLRELQEFLSYDTETSKATLNLLKKYYSLSPPNAGIRSLYSNYLTEILEMILTRKDFTLATEFKQNHKGIISIGHHFNRHRFYQLAKVEIPMGAMLVPH